MSASELGRRVAERRKNMGLSQKALAKRLGYSETWVSQVERGVRVIDKLSVLEKLARALNLSVRDLVSEEAQAAVRAHSRSTERLRYLSDGEPLTLRQLLHELTRDCTHMDEPVFVQLLDLSTGQGSTSLVTGVSVRQWQGPGGKGPERSVQSLKTVVVDEGEQEATP